MSPHPTPIRIIDSTNIPENKVVVRARLNTQLISQGLNINPARINGNPANIYCLLLVTILPNALTFYA